MWIAALEPQAIFHARPHRADPTTLWTNRWPILATLGVVLFGNALAAFFVVRVLRHPVHTALVVAIALA